MKTNNYACNETGENNDTKIYLLPLLLRQVLHESLRKYRSKCYNGLLQLIGNHKSRIILESSNLRRGTISRRVEPRSLLHKSNASINYFYEREKERAGEGERKRENIPHDYYFVAIVVDRLSPYRDFSIVDTMDVE